MRTATARNADTASLYSDKLSPDGAISLQLQIFILVPKVSLLMILKWSIFQHFSLVPGLKPSTRFVELGYYSAKSNIDSGLASFLQSSSQLSHIKCSKMPTLKKKTRC